MSLHRKKSPDKIYDVPVVKKSSLRVLGILLDSGWNFTKHVDFLDRYFRVRANLLQLLRLRLNLGYRCLTNMALNLRNRLSFGTFFILQLSKFQYERLGSIWHRSLKKIFGFNRFVPTAHMCNFLGIETFAQYVQNWFAKWWLILTNFDLRNKFDEYFTWKTSEPAPKKNRYNFRVSTLFSNLMSTKRRKDEYSTVFKTIADGIEPKVEFLKGLGDIEIHQGKQELRKKQKIMRIYKILTEEQIKNRITEINETWFEKYYRKTGISKT